MKKLLASVALLAMVANGHAEETGGFYKATNDLKDAGEKVENSYKSVPNPLRPFAGTLTSPTGNVIQYFAEGADIIAEEGVEGMVKAVVSSGSCLEKSEHPGMAAGCVVKLGGDGFIVIWNTAGYSVTNVVDFGGELLSDVAYIWRDAFSDLGDTLKEAGIPILPEAAYVMKFVMNAAGVIVKVTFGTVADSGRGFIEGGALTVENLVDVPVSLLNLKPKRAMESLGIAIGSAGCTAIDLLLTPVHLVVNLVNAADGGSRRIPTCLEQAKKDFEAIRNGTYVAPQQDNLYSP